mgnify:CR=1 FL=1
MAAEILKKKELNKKRVSVRIAKSTDLEEI